MSPQWLVSARGLRYRKLLGSPLVPLVLCLLLAFFLLAYPLYVIRPFRYQGARELSLALIVLRFRPILHIVLAVAAVALFAWRARTRALFRSFALLGAFLIIGCGMLSRVNVYERMFHPLTHVSVSSATQAKLDGDEEVIAVTVGSAARAYPVRSMSYHHIVNDVLADEPIVATY